MGAKRFMFLFFILFFCLIDKGYAQEKGLQSIVEDKADVTGDGKADIISVKGTQKEKGRFEHVYFEIETSSGLKHVIMQKGGYQPQLAISDLNHDGVDDLFITVPVDYSTNKANHYFYSLKQDVITEYSVPDSLIIQSELLHDYKGRISIDVDKTKTVTLDLGEWADEYEKLGIYQNGCLNEPTELNVQPYSKIETATDKGGRHVIKGTQKIQGMSKKDVIAQVEAIWSFDQGKWVLIDTKVNKFNRKK